MGTIALGAWAAPPSASSDGESLAKKALDPGRVTAFDGSMKYLLQTAVSRPVAGSAKEISYDLAGPGDGVKSTVEYRVYDSPAAAAAHADPDGKQELAEAAEFELPRGHFSAYHSKLGGALAKDVPETLHCLAQTGKTPWSRCYYYAGGPSTIVVVGTTSSTAANEAILITAMGAQGLAQAKP
ncbi:MAG TPA: hypothetical protein VIY53_05225 [Acidobacteriaceae bacterium]